MVLHVGRLFGLLVLATVLLTGPASASEIHEVVLTDGDFSVDVVEAKVGDTVRFVHNDDADHTIYTEEENHAFEASDLEKGGTYDLVLTHAGTIDIYCHEMDDMHLVINVTE